MLRPNGNRILCKRIDAPVVSSTIVIPESIADEPTRFAIVLAVGKLAAPLAEGDVVPGDTVVLGRYAGAPANVEIDGVTYEAAVVSADDVLAVVED